MHLLAILFALLNVAIAYGANAAGEVDVDQGGPLFVVGSAAVLLTAALFVVGVGLAVGSVLCLLLLGMIAAGVVSTSILVAVVRRNPAAGLRAVFLQLGALGGAVCGLVAASLAPQFVNPSAHGFAAFIAGAVAGGCCGTMLGYLFKYAWSRAATAILERFETT